MYVRVLFKRKNHTIQFLFSGDLIQGIKIAQKPAVAKERSEGERHLPWKEHEHKHELHIRLQ